MSSAASIQIYDAQAKELAERYDRLSLLESYGGIEELIRPSHPAPLALDVGAGSGRDAAWLLSLGYEVVAVEPAAGMRAEGERRHLDPKIHWLDDQMPGLAAVHGTALSFDLILLSAVWQHIAPNDRARGFRKLVTLLKPGGLLLMTLREGASPPDRPMYGVSLGEVEGLARAHGVEVLRVIEKADAMARDDVRWTMVTLRMPDDGAGALPLLRGIILADDKSSTYKLGLLRAIARIAEHAPAAARAAEDENDAIDVPLGLVALFWIRMYLPLVRMGIPQAPKNRGADGLGFAKAGFRALLDEAIAPQELRVGSAFAADRAVMISRALGEAVSTIAAMPANFIRFPNSDQRVFTTFKVRSRTGSSELQIDLPTLAGWGQLRIPGAIWRTMARLGSWIEPVLVNEWARLMRGYAERMGVSIPAGQAEAALVWEEPLRDTALGRSAAQRIFAEGRDIYCAWSATKLRPSRLDIDHCMPWSAWPCVDLWNLLPSERRVNQHQKRERLPSGELLLNSRERIIGWWNDAWLSSPTLSQRFWREASAALFVAEPSEPEQLFAGLEWRRLRLRQDQLVPEWTGITRG